MSALSTNDVRDLLAKRYPAPEFATMHEVAPRTGGGTRYADAVAVGLWQSRGHTVHGFEIKVSRSDWLRELKKPEKAEESVFGFCDFWWIVAPAGVVNDGELPPAWGLLEAKPARLVQKTAAPKLTPQPITRAFFASLMRRGFENVDAIANKAVADSIKKDQERFDKRVEEVTEYKVRDLNRLLEKVQAFEETTGLKFGDYAYPPGDIIALAKRLHRLKSYHSASPLSCLVELANSLDKSAKIVREAIEQTGLHLADAQGGDDQPIPPEID